MVQGVIFDCFGVLYGGSLEAFINMSPRDRVEDVRDITKQADYGFITSLDYQEGLAEILRKPLDDIRAVFAEKQVRNDELIDYISRLKSKKTHKIGLLSNVSSEGLKGLFSKKELAELFDAVVLSHEESMAKPNPHIFKIAAERLGVPVGDCVMIDDLESNCDGAEIAGMQSIQHISNSITIPKLEEMMR